MASSEVWGWSSFFGELARFLQGAANNYGSANSQYALYCVNRLSMCHRNVTSLKETVELSNNQDLSGILRDLNELLDCISALYEQWNSYLTIVDAQNPEDWYQVPTARVRPGRGGRPRFDISRDQLLYLKSLTFSWSEIASLLNVSRMTIYRRRRDCGLLDEPLRTMNEDELRHFVEELRTQLPEVGEALVIGRLRSLGYHITRERVRQSIRATDPLNAALRWRGVTIRRPYSVPGPNSLWHIGMYRYLVLFESITMRLVGKPSMYTILDGKPGRL